MPLDTFESRESGMNSPSAPSPSGKPSAVTNVSREGKLVCDSRNSSGTVVATCLAVTSSLLKKSISSEKPFKFFNVIEGHFFKTHLIQQSANRLLKNSKNF